VRTRHAACAAHPRRVACQARFPYAARVTADQPSRPLPVWRASLLLLLGSAVGMFILAALPPVARPTLPVDPEARGAALEQALAGELTKIRPPEDEWAIAIDPADINAWLATRLPKWIEHDEQLASLAAAQSVRIAAIDGQLIVEDSVRAGGAAVVSLPVEPELRDGRLNLAIGTARIGRLPIPGSGSALASLLQETLEKLASGPAQIRLADRRRVELRAVSCEPRRIALVFATLPAVSP